MSKVTNIRRVNEPRKEQKRTQSFAGTKRHKTPRRSAGIINDLSFAQYISGGGTAFQDIIIIKLFSSVRCNSIEYNAVVRD